MNLQYYVLSIVRKDGTVSYLQKGEYSYFSIDYGSFKTAIQFESIEEIKEMISNHPEFTKRIVYSDGSSAPPSIIWSGLGICKDTPDGKGWLVIQKVQTDVVYTKYITDSHQGM